MMNMLLLDINVILRTILQNKTFYKQYVVMDSHV